MLPGTSVTVIKRREVVGSEHKRNTVGVLRSADRFCRFERPQDSCEVRDTMGDMQVPTLALHEPADSGSAARRVDGIDPDRGRIRSGKAEFELRNLS